MLRILLILVIISISYWFGYYTRKKENSFRPVCFVYYDKVPHSQDAYDEIYWGFWELPDTNMKYSIYKISFSKKTLTECFFVVDLKKIVEKANGKTVVLIVNSGYQNKRNNKEYMRKLFYSGSKLFIKEKN